MTVSEEKLYDLFVYCVQFAETMLKEDGEFYPFGAVLTKEFEVGAVGAESDKEQPDSVEVYKSLEKAIRKMAKDKEIVAAAIASYVNIPAKYDPPFEEGIRVLLESKDFSRFIYVSYQIQGDEVVLYEPIPVGVNADLFKNA